MVKEMNKIIWMQFVALGELPKKFKSPKQASIQKSGWSVDQVNPTGVFFVCLSSS